MNKKYNFLLPMVIKDQHLIRHYLFNVSEAFSSPLRRVSNEHHGDLMTPLGGFWLLPHHSSVKVTTVHIVKVFNPDATKSWCGCIPAVIEGFGHFHSVLEPNSALLLCCSKLSIAPSLNAGQGVEVCKNLWIYCCLETIYGVSSWLSKGTERSCQSQKTGRDDPVHILI